MCDCKKVVEGKLLERAKEMLPESENIKVDIGGYTFLLTDNTMKLSQFLPATIEHTVTVKKTGEKKKKKMVQNITASYCMFCGEART